MPQDLNLGNWIREKWGSQVAFAEKLGVQQSRVSKWLSGREGVSQDYQGKIRKLGYSGPWPREEAKEAPAPAGIEPTRSEELWKLTGRVEALEKDAKELRLALHGAIGAIRRLAQESRLPDLQVPSL